MRLCFRPRGALNGWRDSCLRDGATSAMPARPWRWLESCAAIPSAVCRAEWSGRCARLSCALPFAKIRRADIGPPTVGYDMVYLFQAPESMPAGGRQGRARAAARSVARELSFGARHDWTQVLRCATGATCALPGAVPGVRSALDLTPTSPASGEEQDRSSRGAPSPAAGEGWGEVEAVHRRAPAPASAAAAHRRGDRHVVDPLVQLQRDRGPIGRMARPTVCAAVDQLVDRGAPRNPAVRSASRSRWPGACG